MALVPHSTATSGLRDFGQLGTRRSARDARRRYNTERAGLRQGRVEVGGPIGTRCIVESIDGALMDRFAVTHVPADRTDERTSTLR